MPAVPAEIEALLNQGYQARREHRLDDARRIYTEAVELSRQSCQAALLVASLQRLGGIERDMGNSQTALEHYQEATAVCRTLDDPLGLAHTIRHVGDILRESGQLQNAPSCYGEALQIYRRHPDTGTLDLANTLRGLALLQSELGNKTEAIELWTEAGALYNQVWQEPGSPFTEADLAPGVAESKHQIAVLSHA